VQTQKEYSRNLEVVHAQQLLCPVETAACTGAESFPWTATGTKITTKIGAAMGTTILPLSTPTFRVTAPSVLALAPAEGLGQGMADIPTQRGRL